MKTPLIIPDCLPEGLMHQALDYLTALPLEDMDVYSNQFEPKLQVKKELYRGTPLGPVVDALKAGGWCRLLGEHFGINIDGPGSDYFMAFYVYRPGDFLQMHMDSCVHDDQRKVITVNLYFNSVKGGELGIGYSRSMVVDPAFNTLVAITNHDESYHEVQRVREGYRYMLTLGYVLPLKDFPAPGFTNMFRKAWFVPGPEETWTSAQYEARDRRAGLRV